MPTTNWIRETVEDRRAESEAAYRDPLPPPVFVCHECGQEFAARGDLERHLSIHHPVGLPTLYLNGKPLPREAVIRAEFAAADIRALRCTGSEVQEDWQPWTEVQLPRLYERLSQARESTWNIRLFNTRPGDGVSVESRYQLRLRIPEEDALETIDRCFQETLVRETLDHSDLRDFETRLPSSGAASEYGGALGDYVLSILLKERRSQPRSDLAFGEFVTKMKTALEVLQAFRRPVALAVRGCICFNLNSFQMELPGGPELERAFRFFRDVTSLDPAEHRDSTASSIRQDSASPAAICPVDVVTHRLLRACAYLDQGGSVPQVELESLEKLLSGEAPVSEQDIAKNRAICAEASIRLSLTRQAQEHLRAMQFNAPFRQWAQRRLGDLEHGT